MKTKKAVKKEKPLPPTNAESREPVDPTPKFKKRTSESKEISKTDLVAMQDRHLEEMNVASVLDVLLGKLRACQDKHEVFFHRLGVEDMRSRLKDLLEYFDSKLIQLMKEEGIYEFESGVEDRKVVIYYGREKRETLTDTGFKLLTKMLAGPQDDLVKLALLAVPQSRSVFKMAKVKEVAEMLSKECNEFILTTRSDKVGVQYVPKFILEQAGVIHEQTK